VLAGLVRDLRGAYSIPWCSPPSAGGPAFRRQIVQWVPHPSRLFAKGGRQADRTIGIAFHAARARNEIFPQPSFTRTSPGSSKRSQAVGAESHPSKNEGWGTRLLTKL